MATTDTPSLRKALVIGCTNYRQHAAIRTIGEGAKAVAEQLRTNYDGTRNFDVQLLTDQGTNKPPYENEDELMGIIEAFLSGGRPTETGVFYFIGHGMGDRLFDEASLWFCGSEQMTYDIEIKMQWLLERIQKSQFGNIFVLLDCCYSGSFGATLEEPLRDGVCILTACSADQPAVGWMKEHYTQYSLFTGFVKEALQGRAADPITGVISFSSVYNYVSQNLGGKQAPVLRCNVSRYVPLKQHRVSYDNEILEVIHSLFLLNDTDQWPEGSGWRRAYTRRYILGPKDEERFNRSLPFLLRQGFVIEKLGTNNFSPVPQPFYMLTSKGRRLWDMVELEYYSSQS